MGRLSRNCGGQWLAGVWVLWCLLSGMGGALSVGSIAFQDSDLSMQEIPKVNESNRGMTAKQKRDLLKSNFEKMKHDADDLADLAKSLQDDLNKSSEHVLSIQIMEKAEKIEKLARKIKNNAKGY